MVIQTFIEFKNVKIIKQSTDNFVKIQNWRRNVKRLGKSKQTTKNLNGKAIAKRMKRFRQINVNHIEKKKLK